MKVKGFSIVLLSTLLLSVASAGAESYDELSPSAKQLIDDAFIGIEPGSNVDHHVHVVGIGGKVNFFQQQFTDLNKSAEAHGCLSTDFEPHPIYINAKRFRFFSNPILYVKTKGLMKASGVTDSLLANYDENIANDNAISTLYEMVKGYRPGSNKPGRFVLLAMDGLYDEQGEIDWNATDILVPNEYVVRLSECLNRLFIAQTGEQFSPFISAISIHPSRSDSLSELKKYASRAPFLKWLPNSMNINPASPGLKPFFAQMAQQGTTLITHTGHERATEALPEHQQYGNPALHQQALSQGVEVVMAHAGYRGHSHHDGDERANTELFIDMLNRNPEGLRGGLSATVFVESAFCFDFLGGLCPKTKGALVQQLEHFLVNSQNRYGCHIVNGSDFPLPAVSMLNPVDDLIGWQLLDEQHREPLNEIWQSNPLLFDFVLKRHLKAPEDEKQNLAVSMFLEGGC